MRPVLLGVYINVQTESHEILEIDYGVNFPYLKILRPLLSR